MENVQPCIDFLKPPREDLKLTSSSYSKAGRNSSYFKIVPGGGVDQERKVWKSAKCSNYFGRDYRKSQRRDLIASRKQ